MSLSSHSIILPLCPPLKPQFHLLTISFTPRIETKRNPFNPNQRCHVVLPSRHHNYLSSLGTLRILFPCSVVFTRSAFVSVDTGLFRFIESNNPTLHPLFEIDIVIAPAYIQAVVITYCSFFNRLNRRGSAATQTVSLCNFVTALGWCLRQQGESPFLRVRQE